jgi:hypothetical protein
VTRQKRLDDFFTAAKLDFVARRKLILLLDFRRRKVDVRGEALLPLDKRERLA